MKRVKSYLDSLPLAVKLNDNLDTIHNHDELEIVFVLQGKGELLVANTKYPIKKEDIRIINIDTVHRVQSDDSEFKYISLYFDMQFFNQFIPNIWYTYFDCIPNENLGGATESYISILKGLFFSIAKSFFYESKGNNRIKKEAVIEQAILLLTELRNWFTMMNSDFSGEQTERIWIIVDYIYDNYHRRLPLNEVAEQIFVTPNYLSHYVKNNTGMNFQDLVNFIRAEEALKLLIGTDKSITKISYECGFSEPKYFNKYFTKYYGISPQQYRKEYGQNNLEIQSNLSKGFFIEDFSRSDISLVNNYIENFTSQSVLINTKTRAEAVSIDLNVEEELEFLSNSNIILIDNLETIYRPAIQDLLVDTLKHIDIEGINVLSIKSTSKNDKALINEISNKISCKITCEGIACDVNSFNLFYDFDNDRDGLYTPGGIKTPLYYIKSFESMLNKAIIKQDNFYSVTGDSDSLTIFIDNYSDTSEYRDSYLEITFSINGVLKGIYEKATFTINDCDEYTDNIRQIDNITKVLSSKQQAFVSEMNMPDIWCESIETQNKRYEISAILGPGTASLIQIKYRKD